MFKKLDISQKDGKNLKKKWHFREILEITPPIIQKRDICQKKCVRNYSLK